MTHRSIEAQLRGYRLTTAEIIYHMPDHPDLLQTFIWQTMDIAPNFPVIKKFLDFWETSLEGKLHSVKIAGQELIEPVKYRFAAASMSLH